MHVLTSTIFDILVKMLTDSPTALVSLSSALAEGAQREQFLAMIQKGRRFDVGVKYGLFKAQLALALSGKEPNDVLAELIDILAARDQFSQTGAPV
jgi:UTP--glucose-1-phosphate uridylyltransferase